jgi:hypothetical protein
MDHQLLEMAMASLFFVSRQLLGKNYSMEHCLRSSSFFFRLLTTIILVIQQPLKTLHLPLTSLSLSDGLKPLGKSTLLVWKVARGNNLIGLVQCT